MAVDLEVLVRMDWQGQSGLAIAIEQQQEPISHCYLTIA
jgi:hypothetical protein